MHPVTSVCVKVELNTWIHVALCSSAASGASSSPRGVFHQMGPPNLPSPEAQEMQPVCTSGVIFCCAPLSFRGTLHDCMDLIMQI